MNGGEKPAQNGGAGLLSMLVAWYRLMKNLLGRSTASGAWRGGPLTSPGDDTPRPESADGHSHAGELAPPLTIAAEWNRDTPWRQGHLLGNDAIDALGLRHAVIPEQTIVAVATHDCDLAQDPQFEPTIEVVVGCLANKDGNCTHAKNARKLHIEFAGAAPFWAEFEATAKVSVDKPQLNQFVPRTDAHLSTDDHAIFQMWLASRYRRSAFADEFERRLTKETKLAEKIAKAVKQHGELIAGVFFDVDGGEEVKRNGPDDTYSLDITLLHTADADFEKAEEAAQAASDAIKKAFEEKLFEPKKQWQHIELRSCEPLSEAVLTYQIFKQLKRWRLEHISLAADPQQPLLPE